MDVFVISLLNQVAFSSILFLIAAGLTLILGVMGILNLAHGAFYMVGAYVGVALAEKGLNFPLAALAGGTAAGVAGWVIERIFLKRLYRKFDAQVLLTFGLVYIFTNLVLWIWGPWPKMGTAPFVLSGFITIGEFRFPVYRLGLILFAMITAVGLWWLIEKTRVGAMIRAGMDDKEMAMGLGVNYALISSLVFCLGIFMVGLAGFIGAPILGASLGSAWDVLLLALIVIVIGGKSSVPGALIGSLLIGVIDTIAKFVYPGIAMFTIYLVLVFTLLFKPSGLMGKRGM